ncbi:unnamed protein product [Litomosoides sigmodontis]|uniref:Uncharacterized protein n=1 Tax=Litomosoides sigmodontis TaxID=42156 RepID=A0A3P6SZS8_LITSI|nr:unnamed protein product [Litomosoides sigmodontis]
MLLRLNAVAGILGTKTIIVKKASKKAARKEHDHGLAAPRNLSYFRLDGHSTLYALEALQIFWEILFKKGKMFDLTTVILFGATLMTAACSVPKLREFSFVSDSSDFYNWTRLSRELIAEKGGKPVIPVCSPMKNCTADLECHGGKCVGIAVGTCNCGACLQFAPCKSDVDCGGLRGACTNQKYCDCDKGFKCAGLKGIFDALLTVCNRKECKPNKSSCFGLPCNDGICTCASQP